MRGSSFNRMRYQWLEDQKFILFGRQSFVFEAVVKHVERIRNASGEIVVRVNIVRRHTARWDVKRDAVRQRISVLDEIFQPGVDLLKICLQTSTQARTYLCMLRAQAHPVAMNGPVETAFIKPNPG